MGLLYLSPSASRELTALFSTPAFRTVFAVSCAVSLLASILSQRIKGQDWCLRRRKPLVAGIFLLCSLCSFLATLNFDQYTPQELALYALAGSFLACVPANRAAAHGLRDRGVLLFFVLYALVFTTIGLRKPAP